MGVVKFGLELTKGVAAALPTLEHLASSGLSVNEILDAARAFGESFNDSQARAMIQGFRGNLVSAGYWQAVNKTDQLNPYRLPVAPSNLRDPQEAVIRVYGKDPLTGDDAEVTATFGFNLGASQDYMGAYAMQQLDDELSPTDFRLKDTDRIIPEGYEVIRVQVSPNAL